MAPAILRPSDAAYDLERFSPRDAAEYLAVSVATVYVEVAAGRLGCRRTSSARKSHIRFSQAQLDLWRTSRIVPATDTPTQRVERERRQLRAVVTPIDLPMPAKRRFS